MNRFLQAHPVASFCFALLLAASLFFQITYALAVHDLQANICTVVKQSRAGNPVLYKQWQLAATTAQQRASKATGIVQENALAQQAQDLRIAQVYAPSVGIQFPGC